jgi:hypothetical protein
MLEDYTPYQQRIIKRYYANQDRVALQRLSELVTDLYLADGNRRDHLWKSAVAAMKKLGVSQGRIEHLLQQDDPALIARLVKELMGNQ